MSSDFVLRTIAEVSAQFDTADKDKRELERILLEYPRVTPAEAWIALPILFWRGDLDQKALHSMPYAEFLKTPYWAAVSEHVKDERPWCALCTEPLAGPLQVHHRTYIHRGEEWRHLRDLVVLCSDCHQHFHNKSCV